MKIVLTKKKQYIIIMIITKIRYVFGGIQRMNENRYRINGIANTVISIGFIVADILPWLLFVGCVCSRVRFRVKEHE